MERGKKAMKLEFAQFVPVSLHIWGSVKGTLTISDTNAPSGFGLFIESMIANNTEQV
jgi:hypothetical protein